MTSFEMTKLKIKGMDFMNPNVIILWEEEDILLRSIELLLNTRQGWKTTLLSDGREDGAFIDEMRRTLPDVLIVHENIFFGRVKLFQQLARENSKLKILTVNLQNNEVNIYRKHTLFIKQAKDLIAIIEDDRSSTPSGGDIHPNTSPVSNVSVNITERTN